MLIPTKHENLNKNSLVIGSGIISYLKKHKSENIETLFQLIRKDRQITLDQFINTMTFLWLSKIVSVKFYRAHLR